MEWTCRCHDACLLDSISSVLLEGNPSACVSIFLHFYLLNYLTINQQVGHEARENRNGQRQVLSEVDKLFEGINDEGTEGVSNT